MFLNKVGSDACLVLEGTVTDLETGRVEINQTFSYEDLKKALETKIISVTITLAVVSIHGIVVITSDADPEEIPPTDPYFMVAVPSAEGFALVQFTSTDNSHWVGTIEIGG